MCFFGTTHDGRIIDDGGIKAVFACSDDGIGTVAAVPWLRETAGIDKMNAICLVDERLMGMTEEDCLAIIFQNLVHKGIQLVLDIFHMTVSEQDFTIFGFDDGEIVTAVAAVTVAFDSDDRHAQLVLQRFCIRKMISRMGDEVDILKLFPDISDFIEFSVGVPDY